MNTTLPNYDAWKTREPEDHATDICGNCGDRREEHSEAVVDGKSYTICPQTWELITGGDGRFDERQ